MSYLLYMYIVNEFYGLKEICRGVGGGGGGAVLYKPNFHQE
jgi:hypothetical protein